MNNRTSGTVLSLLVVASTPLTAHRSPLTLSVLAHRSPLTLLVLAHRLPLTLFSSSVQDTSAGKLVYVKWCAGCHGETGAGDGPAAHYMLPRPRDFTGAVF